MHYKSCKFPDPLKNTFRSRLNLVLLTDDVKNTIVLLTDDVKNTIVLLIFCTFAY